MIVRTCFRAPVFKLFLYWLRLVQTLLRREKLVGKFLVNVVRAPCGYASARIIIYPCHNSYNRALDLSFIHDDYDKRESNPTVYLNI